MSEYLFLDGVVWDAAPDGITSEGGPPTAPAAIGSTTSCVDSRTSILPPASGGRPTLPLELFIEIFEQLAIPQAQSSFKLNKEYFKTLVSLALLNQTVHGLVTPILYRRIRLVTPGAIRSFRSTLSYPARGAYLCRFVKYFFASDSKHNSTTDIPGILDLIRDSVEYLHVSRWPSNSSAASELRDSVGSARNLRQLSIGRGSTVSPDIRTQGLSGLQSVVLGDTNAILASTLDGDGGEVGRNLSIYCVVPGTMPPSRVVMMVEECCKEFIATGRDLPPFRVVMFFLETSALPAHLWASNRAMLPDRWFSLPVPASFQRLASLEFDQWLHSSIEDGSLWEINPIPMSEWAAWLKEKSEQSLPEGPPRASTELRGQSTGPNHIWTSITQFFGVHQ